MTQRTEKGSEQGGAHVAVVGATGVVGQAILHCIDALGLPVRRLDLVASARSAGKLVSTPVGDITVQDIEHYAFEDVDIALFSAGKDVSLAHAPRAVKQGALVIDNTSAFRMDDGIPLVVPEVNPQEIRLRPGIIANPNCSTIEMVLALKAIDDAAGLETVRVSTYQSCSGAGQKGIDALLDETHQALAGRRPVYSQVHARGIAFDVVPQIGAILTHGFTEEEMKMIGETKKILSRPDLRISATCVRVPVLRGHCEVVHVTTRQALPPKEAEQALNAMPGLRVTDIQDPLDYPTATQSEGIFETLIGRVREDYAADKGLIFWIVSDNLLKGAALNAVQVACIAWNQGRMDSNAN